ncbi:autotransporter domain-containing protein [Bradyrhizobium sp. dw_411]|uniref:autotransporter domain-containing protein n=1 Tax=Bradyrhizobium sp. dw_411 TaxID=2720082 RepID=UPI001BCC3F3F|nr:autotransporter domain-containing protein [Bradyrhizobium sp. dw_411]
MGKALRRLTLLCSASAIAISVIGSAQAGQASLSSFATYDPAMASTIVPGALALFQVPVDSIHPTQLNEGLTEVGKKTAGFDLLTPSQLQANLLTSIEPVVIGPGGQLYLTDGHHTFTALQDSIYGPSNPNVFVNVIANFSTLTTAQFFAQMQALNFLLPINEGVSTPINLSNGSPIPSALTGLTSDPYRGLEYSILKNKSSILFTTAGNITGAVGASTAGLDKMTGFYSDFFEADAYRGANNGLGLPYLSPGDIAIATRWNLNPASTTTLPNVPGTVTAAQLPGFILNSNFTESGVISNATLATGAIDGNGTFTGITSLNVGTAAQPATIGTPNVGLIMQVGNDKGFSITLTGANTYTGGTSILAGNLIVANDAALGAAPTGAAIDLHNIKTSVQAANGIIFNSLDEGNGTLTLGTAVGTGATTFTTARTIAVGGETATINLNGNITTLTGQIVSLGVGVGGVGVGNATGFSDLTIDDNSNNAGKLILSTASPNFFGNLIIGNANKPTVEVMNDAALGNTTGPAATIGQIELNGGTLQAGALFTATERNMFLQSASKIDVNGFATSWGSLTDVQRGLEILNTNTATAGAVTFSSFVVGGGTVPLQLAGGAAGETITFSNIVRQSAATLVLQPTNASSLGTATEKVFAPNTTNTNGIVAPWIVTNNGVTNGGGPYDFVTNTASGLVKTTYTVNAVGAGTGTSVVDVNAPQTLGANASAYALKVESGTTMTLTGNTLTLGDGTNPAGLILSSATPFTGGTLAFGGSEAVVWLGATSAITTTTLTGTGGMTIAGSGSLSLSGTSTLTGAITIDSGTLTLATANYFVTNPTILLADTSSKPAPATLAIAANNTIASLNSVGSNSTVTISAGAKLTIGDGQNLSSTLSSNITESGAATAGALTKNGSGLLDLSGMGKNKLNLVAASTVIVNGGELRVAANIFKNANAIVLNNVGTELQFAQSGGGVFASAISGAGLVHLIGGTLQLTGANSYTGGTVVEQGSTLDLTTANVSTTNANITNAGGLLVFDQASNGTYSGVISDGRQMLATSGPMLSGSLVKDDSTGTNSGNLTLSAVQTYSGGTFVEAGTLTLGVANAVASSSGVDLGRVGGPTGTGAAPAGGPVTATLALSANNTLQGLMSETGNNTAVQLNANTLTLNVGSGDVFNFGGVLAGTGNLVMSGTGAEFLNGTSTYTGTTTVNGGLLSVNGSIATSSLTTVNAGGALGGTGTVGNTFVNGGTLVPGNNSTGATGTLTVNGNLAFTTAAQYLVQVTQAGASMVNVISGATMLAGTVQVVSPTNSYRFNQPYTILTTNNGLGGTQFNSLSLPNFITGALSYTPNNVSLGLSLQFEQAAGLNTNQKTIASAIDRAANTGGSLPAGLSALLGLPPAALPGVLTQLSGEVGTGSQQTTFSAMTQFLGSLLDHVGGGGDPAATPGASQYADEANAYASNGPSGSKSERDAYAAIYNKVPPRPADLFAQRWSVWVSSFGGSQTTDGNAAAGSNGSTSSIVGMAVGADYRISPNTVAGFALAGGGTSFSVNGGGSGRSDLFQAGAFIKHTQGAAYISGALAYGWQDVTTTRSVTVAGLDQLQANFDANAFSGRIEGGYRFALPWAGITPYAAGQFTTFVLPSYAEQAVAGTNNFALAYGAQTVTDPRSELGLRTDRSYALTNAVLTLRSRTAWAYDYNTSRGVGATFQSLPGSSFVVNGAAPAHNSALTSASAEIKWMDGFSLAATFDGEFSNMTRSYAGKGVARYSW